jgi:hypothetical protein
MVVMMAMDQRSHSGIESTGKAATLSMTPITSFSIRRRVPHPGCFAQSLA